MVSALTVQRQLAIWGKKPSSETREQNLEKSGTFLWGRARAPTAVAVDFVMRNKGDVVGGQKLGGEPICTVVEAVQSTY